jgi:hypothetical protein
LSGVIRIENAARQGMVAYYSWPRCSGNGVS